MIRIGNNIELKHGLFLAPMAGFTDAPFRLLCQEYGAEYTTTEMVSALALVHHDEKTNALASIDAKEKNCSVQLFGSSAEALSEATGILLTDWHEKNRRLPAAIDINMGCPVKKIVFNGEGSALMKDPDKCGRIVEAVQKAAQPFQVPVTVKIRAGFDTNTKNAPAVSQAVAQAGASCIAVHARTREEMYRPGIDYDVLARVREALPSSVPVIGNGDIASAEDALKMFRETGVDGVMIGRVALGNPWLFQEITAALEGKAFEAPALPERIAVARALLREIVASSENEKAAVCSTRGRLSHFLTGIRGGAAARNQLNRALTVTEADEALLSVLTS